MPICGKDINMNFSSETAVNKAVLLCDLTAPSIGRNTFERLGMTCACSGVLSYFIERLYGFLKSGRFTSSQLGQTFLDFGGIGDGIHAHREFSQLFMSSRLWKVMPLPSAISFSALSSLAKYSSRVISLGSVCFSATSFRMYLAARFSRLSSLAIMLKSCSISVCNFNLFIIS